MRKITEFIKENYREFFFQIIVFTVLFLFYYYNRHHKEVEVAYKIPFFINYAIAAYVINYLFLPKLFYTKKYKAFIVSVLLLVTVVISIEELVLEDIYFPDTRGAYFPGVFDSLLSVLPVIIIFVGFKFAWDFTEKQGEVDRLKTLMKDSELQFLKSQMHPHFLFNNLNNLYAYALEESPKTPSIILELSSVLRYMLYDCRADFVLLRKELAHLENFTALNELQIEERGNIQYSVNNRSENYRIAPLVLMVFIENAFKHSTVSQSENIVIDIDVDISEKGVLNFTCTNSFLLNKNTDSISKGVGLENVKKRLLLLYPNSHKLEITDNENTFEVNLKMQLNE